MTLPSQAEGCSLIPVSNPGRKCVSVPATCMIVSSSPGYNNVDALFLGEVLECLPGTSFPIAALESSPGATRIASTGHHIQYFTPPKEHFPEDTRVSRRIASAIHHASFYRSEINALAEKVSEFVRINKPLQIWTVLTSLAAIEITWRLLKSQRTPVLVQLWDAPEHLMQNRRLDRISRSRTLRKFHDILKRAERVAVIGESMRDQYALHTRQPPVIVRHGIKDDVLARTDVSDSAEFRIGFCGGMYAGSAWRCLQAALEILNWQLAGRNVALIIASPRIELTASRPARTRFYGWQSAGESVESCIQRSTELMAACDLLYLPQSFDSFSRPLTELSFPSKLSTYATTGRPILVHTPTYGSLNQFCAEHNFGLVCNELNAEHLAGLLSSAVQNGSRMNDLASQTALIGSKVLNQSQFCDAVRRFVCAELSP
jgi:hypothetical protein